MLRDTANITHAWDGGDCRANITSPNTLLKSFTTADLDNMFYKLEDRQAAFTTGGSCQQTPTYQIRILLAVQVQAFFVLVIQ